MDNMPILYRNIIDSLPSQFAVDTFLWASDKFENDRFAYKAEAFAREAARLIPQAKVLVDMAQMARLRNGDRVMDAEQEADLIQFLQVRHANWRMGGNVKSSPPTTRA